jgi:hypothetical protein
MLEKHLTFFVSLNWLVDSDSFKIYRQYEIINTVKLGYNVIKGTPKIVSL